MWPGVKLGVATQAAVVTRRFTWRPAPKASGALHTLHLRREQVPLPPGCERPHQTRKQKSKSAGARWDLWAHNGQGIASAASSGKQRQAERAGAVGKNCERRAPKIVGLKIDGPAPFRKYEKQGGVCSNVLFHQHRRDLSPLGPGYRSDLPPAPKPSCQLAGRANEGNTRADLVHSFQLARRRVALRCWSTASCSSSERELSSS